MTSVSSPSSAPRQVGAVAQQLRLVAARCASIRSASARQWLRSWRVIAYSSRRPRCSVGCMRPKTTAPRWRARAAATRLARASTAGGAAAKSDTVRGRLGVGPSAPDAMRGPLIESPTPPSRNPRRLATILALGVGIARRARAAGASAPQEPAPDRRDAARRRRRRPTRHARRRRRPRPARARRAAAPRRAAPRRRRPRRRRRRRRGCYTPPVGAPLDFVRDPLPKFALPEERPTVRVPPPPRETHARARDRRAAPPADADGEARRGRRRRGRRRRASSAPRWRRPPRPRRSRTSSSATSRSRRSCCRSTRPPGSSTASRGRSSRRSTRSRPTTAATSTSRRPARPGWMQFMPASWQRVRRRRQRGRPQGPLQPGRRDLRRRALPQGGGRRGGSAQGDLRLQPRRLVRRLGAAPGRASSPACRPTSSAR